MQNTIRIYVAERGQEISEPSYVSSVTVLEEGYEKSTRH